MPATRLRFDRSSLVVGIYLYSLLAHYLAQGIFNPDRFCSIRFLLFIRALGEKHNNNIYYLYTFITLIIDFFHLT